MLFLGRWPIGIANRGQGQGRIVLPPRRIGFPGGPGPDGPGGPGQGGLGDDTSEDNERNNEGNPRNFPVMLPVFQEREMNGIDIQRRRFSCFVMSFMIFLLLSSFFGKSNKHIDGNGGWENASNNVDRISFPWDTAGFRYEAETTRIIFLGNNAASPTFLSSSLLGSSKGIPGLPNHQGTTSTSANSGSSTGSSVSSTSSGLSVNPSFLQKWDYYERCLVESTASKTGSPSEVIVGVNYYNGRSKATNKERLLRADHERVLATDQERLLGIESISVRELPKEPTLIGKTLLPTDASSIRSGSDRSGDSPSSSSISTLVSNSASPNSVHTNRTALNAGLTSLNVVSSQTNSDSASLNSDTVFHHPSNSLIYDAYSGSLMERSPVSGEEKEIRNDQGSPLLSNYAKDYHSNNMQKTNVNGIWLRQIPNSYANLTMNRPQKENENGVSKEQDGGDTRRNGLSKREDGYGKQQSVEQSGTSLKEDTLDSKSRHSEKKMNSRDDKAANNDENSVSKSDKDKAPKSDEENHVQDKPVSGANNVAVPTVHQTSEGRDGHDWSLVSRVYQRVFPKLHSSIGVGASWLDVKALIQSLVQSKSSMKQEDPPRREADLDKEFALSERTLKDVAPVVSDAKDVASLVSDAKGVTSKVVEPSSNESAAVGYTEASTTSDKVVESSPRKTMVDSKRLGYYTCLFDVKQNSLIGQIKGNQLVHSFFDEASQKLVLLFSYDGRIEVWLVKKSGSTNGTKWNFESKTYFRVHGSSGGVIDDTGAMNGTPFGTSTAIGTSTTKTDKYDSTSLGGNLIGSDSSSVTSVDTYGSKPVESPFMHKAIKDEGKDSYFLVKSELTSGYVVLISILRRVALVVRLSDGALIEDRYLTWTFLSNDSTKVRRRIPDKFVRVGIGNIEPCPACCGL